MKYISFIIIFVCVCLSGFAQQFSLETPLDETINETSGLIYLNNTLISHNDSEGTNQLFDIDTSSGAVTRVVTITNATNIDWEDLTYDDTYIYIADIGNYQGDRTDLKVYRIAIADYFSSTSVTADSINFSYSDQTDFTTSPLATNFDAEALIHYNNALYVFSKNWLDGNTNIYQLSKTPGTYSISTVDTITSGGLISGATHNSLNNTIVLSGYDLNGAFLIALSGYNSGLFSNGSVIKTSIAVPTNYSPQIEGITPINATEYYISSEENSPDISGLYSFNLSTLSVLDFETTSITFYPNPGTSKITLNQADCKTKIYTITGQLVKTSVKQDIDISDLKSGIYLIKIEKSGLQRTTQRLVIQ